MKLAHEQHLGQVEFVEEKVSGKVSWRKRQIATLLDSAQPGGGVLRACLRALTRTGARGEREDSHDQGSEHAKELKQP